MVNFRPGACCGRVSTWMLEGHPPHRPVCEKITAEGLDQIDGAMGDGAELELGVPREEDGGEARGSRASTLLRCEAVC